MKNFTKSVLLTAGLALGISASAADQLNNTKWTTYNDSGKPDAVIQFNESNGKLSAKIVEVLDPRATNKTVCDTCKGKFKNKPLTTAAFKLQYF